MAQQVINYFDAQLYASDVDIFTSNEWLNDNCIGFYMMYIYQMVCQASSMWLLVDPAVVSFVMLLDEEEEEEFSKNENLREKQKVLIPVNNAQSSQTYGTHWSLLGWDLSSNRFHHYDSSHGMNDGAARRTAQRFLGDIAQKS